MESLFSTDTLFTVAVALALIVAGMLFLIILHLLHFIRIIEDISETARREFNRFAEDFEDIRGEIRHSRRHLKSFIHAPRSITLPKGGRETTRSHSRHI